MGLDKKFPFADGLEPQDDNIYTIKSARYQGVGDVDYLHNVSGSKDPNPNLLKSN